MAALVKRAQETRKIVRFQDDPARSKLLVMRARGSLVELNLMDCDWTDKDAREVCSTSKTGFPKLAHINLSGAIKLSSRGFKTLTGKHSRLSSFVCHNTPQHSLCKDMRLTPAYIKAISTYPSLHQLELTLGSKIKDGDLDCLTRLPHLEALSVFFEGFNPPVPPLAGCPSLRFFRMDVGPWSNFNWHLLISRIARRSLPMVHLTIQVAPCKMKDITVNSNATVSISFFDHLLAPLDSLQVFDWCSSSPCPLDLVAQRNTAVARLNAKAGPLKTKMERPHINLREQPRINHHKLWNPIRANRGEYE